MLDFGALPPEINSGRMYVGAGSGPMLAAAAAWDSLAADLQSAASSYGSTVEGLVAGPWTGPSSMTMAAAASPFVTWVSGAAAQAEEAAAQAKLAAGAYETAFAATVPPPVIAANRALLAVLVATNILGQNTPAIAATETHYLEMWAQDAAAMYAYAGSSSSASQLTPFTEPPQTTNTAGTARNRPRFRRSSASGLNIGTQAVPADQLCAEYAAKHGNKHLSTRAASGGDCCRVAAPSAGGADDRPHKLEHHHVDLPRDRIRRSSGCACMPGGPFLSFGQTFAYAQNGQGLQPFGTPKVINGALAPYCRRDAAFELAAVVEWGAGLGRYGPVIPGGQHVGATGLDRSRARRRSKRSPPRCPPTWRRPGSVARQRERHLQPDGPVEPRRTRHGRFGDLFRRRRCRGEIAGRARRGRPRRGHHHRDSGPRGL